MYTFTVYANLQNIVESHNVYYRLTRIMAPKTLLLDTLLKAYTMFLSKWSFKTYFGENRVE